MPTLATFGRRPQRKKSMTITRSLVSVVDDDESVHEPELESGQIEFPVSLSRPAAVTALLGVCATSQPARRLAPTVTHNLVVIYDDAFAYFDTTKRAQIAASH